MNIIKNYNSFIVFDNFKVNKLYFSLNNLIFTFYKIQEKSISGFLFWAFLIKRDEECYIIVKYYFESYFSRGK